MMATADEEGHGESSRTPCCARVPKLKCGGIVDAAKRRWKVMHGTHVRARAPGRKQGKGKGAHSAGEAVLYASAMRA